MLGQYSRSIEFLEIVSPHSLVRRKVGLMLGEEQCVSSPGAAASAIQIDAYKKLVLVQLLHEGKVSPLRVSSVSYEHLN